VDATRQDDATSSVAQLLTLPEAAAALGISIAAVRKRRERGMLRGLRRDGRWYVWVGPDDPGASTDDKLRDSGQDTRHSLSSELITHVEQENAWLRGQLEARDRQIEELHVLLQRALEQRPPLVLPSPDQAVEGRLQPERPHWWQRLFTGP
jgi:hypothetical protein